MIQLSHNYSLPEREEEIIPIKVVGVGGAGSNALDRIVLDGMDKADLIAINTDVQSLAASVAEAEGRKVDYAIPVDPPEASYSGNGEAAQFHSESSLFEGQAAAWKRVGSEANPRSTLLRR